MSLPLYEQPDLYLQLFNGPFEGELEMCAALLPPPPARVLSLGCGAARVESHLSQKGWRIHGIDSSPAMIEAARAADPAGLYEVTRIEEVAGASHSCDAVIAPLLSVAYISFESTRCLLNALRACVAPGGPVLLDTPVAYRPASLQGVSESLDDDGLNYRFDYDDTLERNACGARIATRMRIQQSGETAERRAALTVLRPGAWRRIAHAAGFPTVRFHAPYESASVRLPPNDARRAVVELR